MGYKGAIVASSVVGACTVRGKSAFTFRSRHRKTTGEKPTGNWPKQLL